MQKALLDGGAEAPDEARVRAGVLQALAHVRQHRLRLRQVRHDVEELAHADAAHRLVHIVLQALGPRAERPILYRHATCIDCMHPVKRAVGPCQQWGPNIRLTYPNVLQVSAPSLDRRACILTPGLPCSRCALQHAVTLCDGVFVSDSRTGYVSALLSRLLVTWPSTTCARPCTVRLTLPAVTSASTGIGSAPR